MKDSFILYTDYTRQVDRLSNEQSGELFKAILHYASGKEIPKMDDITAMAFDFIQSRMERDFEQYKRTVEARKEAGRRGGETRAKNINQANEANATFDKANLANQADNDNEYECVNDKNKNTMCDARDLFERLWKLYPNKKGKGQVSDTQKKRLLAIGETELVKAIERYSSELQKDAGWRKPQNGSTFFNSGYVDYLDGNFVPSEQKPTQEEKPPNRFNNFPQREYNWDELERQLIEN